MALRVRPGTSSGITKFSEHEADGCEAQECERLAIEVLPIFGKPSASIEPSNGALDHPTTWEHDESFGVIGALDDFSFEVGQDFCQGLLEFRPLIASVGKQLFQERIHPEQGCKKQNAAVAVLDIGGMNDHVQQQA